MCHDPNAVCATDEFASFSHDQSFQDAHVLSTAALPPFIGKMVTFPVAGGANGNAYKVVADSNSKKYLLLLHEWWGLNDFVKNEADNWSKELNINVLAIDLYDGQVASTPADAGKLMQSNDKIRASAIIEGAAKYAGEGADFRTLGWCFGGGWSLQTTLLLKSTTKACVMYYGMPEKDVEKLKTLTCPVLFVHASKDKWINDEVVASFEKDMQVAQKKLQVSRYDADHAFANPSSPRHNEAAAKASREVVTAFLKQSLK